MIPIQHIHPMLVHFPIVLVFALGLFDLAATIRGASVTGRTAVGNVSTSIAVLAALSAAAAYYFGGLALTFAEDGGFSSEIAETHESLGQMVAVGLAIWAVVRAILWWRNTKVTSQLAYAFPVVAIGFAGLVAWTAYFGGQLVFDLGVNVAKATMGA